MFIPINLLVCGAMALSSGLKALTIGGVAAATGAAVASAVSSDDDYVDYDDSCESSSEEPEEKVITLNYSVPLDLLEKHTTRVI